ncbi:MAG TPA: START-like domain-containing protein, partial [Bacteroidia bacterium]|nr:START-like domain-containing protein [Bacteroidia bacterium]
MSEIKSQKKQKYTLEFEIKSSPKILFNYLSTASGLEEWFADKVNIREGDYMFQWDGTEQR